ncbi:MAG: translation initiation factor 2 [Paracoccus sp. (in: a-proteobacteria)]
MIKYVVAACAALSLTGCATITRGTEEVLVVKSIPPGAQVKMSNGLGCSSTPCSFKLPRKSELDILITRPGCKAQQIQVTNAMSSDGGTAIAGNIVAGGIIGIGIDASSGATQDLIPNPVEVKLECRG